MNQSQNDIFTSPRGEENLMNSNHRDSESITVLGTDRVEQMTKTYNDIDMVTH
uniref:Trafficking kinesin protein 2 n=1 Tax=Cavia porcellus TaxID=10141 RepID=A0A286XD75_CAVPO